jgi:hypothetical protein
MIWLFVLLNQNNFGDKLHSLIHCTNGSRKYYVVKHSSRKFVEAKQMSSSPNLETQAHCHQHMHLLISFATL